jgi:hypothetical protein
MKYACKVVITDANHESTTEEFTANSASELVRKLDDSSILAGVVQPVWDLTQFFNAPLNTLSRLVKVDDRKKSGVTVRAYITIKDDKESLQTLIHLFKSLNDSIK